MELLRKLGIADEIRKIGEKTATPRLGNTDHLINQVSLPLHPTMFT